MRNKTENQYVRAVRNSGILVAAALASMLLTAPLASAHAETKRDSVATSDTPSGLDPLITNSIGTTLSNAHSALDNNDLDHKGASALSPVQIPSYLSILSDRRILVLFSMIGLCVVWINRHPQSRDDSKN